MVLVRSDGKQGNGENQGTGDVVTSKLGKCTRDRRRLVAAGVTTTEFSPDGSRTPKSWITTSVAMNLFLLIAVIYHEWSRSQVAKGLSRHVVDPVNSEISPLITTPQVVTGDPCSGHGIYELEYETGYGACRCHPCFTGSDCSSTDNGCIVDLYQYVSPAPFDVSLEIP